MIKEKMDAGDKKNTAGGSWVAGFAKTRRRFWL
jgi:hypothetical protein